MQRLDEVASDVSALDRWSSFMLPTGQTPGEASDSSGAHQRCRIQTVRDGLVKRQDLVIPWRAALVRRAGPYAGPLQDRGHCVPKAASRSKKVKRLKADVAQSLPVAAAVGCSAFVRDPCR